MDNPELALDQASVHNCSVSELDLDLRVSLTNGYLVKKNIGYTPGHLYFVIC